MTCSYLEIYNETIFDLLDAGSDGLAIREDVKRGVFVRDLQELTVENADEACEVLKVGGRNRRVASTSMNRESSRSHAVFTVCIKSLEKNGTITNVRESRLNLIDLAGSERQRDTQVGHSWRQPIAVHRTPRCSQSVALMLGRWLQKNKECVFRCAFFWLPPVCMWASILIRL